ncbi:hypothetical protein JCM15519_07820 [Fundidesulfovibrio butyratiphilus]
MRAALAFAFMVALVACASLSCAQNGPSPGTEHRVADKRRILYFNSYHNGYEWSDQILEGLRDGLNRSGVPYDLIIEYLDTKRFPDPDLQRTLVDFYRRKYAGSRVDVIVVSDDYAYQFMIKNQPVLFPGTPVVFSGVNDFGPKDLEGRNDFTGVMEYPDFLTNFELARRLFPDLERIVVVGDESITGQAIQKQIRVAVSPLAQSVTIEYWSVKTLPELLARAESLKKRDVVFMIPIYLGAKTQVFSAYEVLGILARKAPVPVFSAWRFLLGNGMVGGKLHSGQGEGRLAASMALRILSGERPESIPVVETLDDTYVFDYLALKRFSIPPDRLPEGSELIHEPLNFYTIDKKLFWTVTAGVSFLLAGAFLLVVSTLQKRKAQRELTEQVNFLNILMDTIPLPLSYRATDGRYLGCNRAFERWFGVTRAELLDNADHPLAKQIGPGESALMRRIGVESFETDMVDAVGGSRGVIVSQASYPNARGDVAGLVEAVQDISQRRAAEQALRRSQAMLQTVLDNIPQLVYWLDTRLRVVGANRPFLEFFGVDESRLGAGHSLDELIPQARAAGAISGRVLDSDRAERRGALELPLPGREPARLELTVVPLHDETGRVLGVLGAAEDVTLRASLERQLLQSQKMEAIGALAGGIAHDFNNILTSIINSAELALMDIAPESDAAQDLERTLKAARRGSRLVQQILAFSRPSQAGFTPVDLAEVAHEALAIFSATLPRNIALEKMVPQDRPLMAFADATQIHQILMNLCANAFQSLRASGGKLRVELSRVDLQGEQAAMHSLAPGRYIRLCVEDNGPGIAPEILDRIFDPFFTTKPKEEGTGLGLAVAHGIVKAHKGAMTVRSQPGERTTFEVFLPALGDAAARERPRDAGPVRKGGEHVLFIEDDEDQLRIIPRALGVRGYRVTAKSGAEQALDFLSKTHGEHKVEVVVTDYDMPGLSGVDFAERLLPLDPDLPVILVSGRRGALTAAARAGNIKNVLLKPYDGDDLARAIGQVLDRPDA